VSTATLTRFQYRAATADGRVVEGIVQAASQPTALEELRRLRLYPIDVAPIGERRGRTRSLGKAPALALFTRTVATLLAAGVPLERALSFAAQQARHPAIARAAHAAQRDLQNGSSLSDALARQPDVFNPLIIAMVSAGEDSGALDEAMASLAEHLDELSELRAQIRSSLVYPALMGVVSGVGITILLLFVIPRFASMLGSEGIALPLSTQLLIAASRLVTTGWWLILLVGVVAVLGVRAWIARAENRKRWDAWRLRAPLIGDLEHKYATARFARAFGMLVRAGQPVLRALRAARPSVRNLALQELFDRAAEAVSHGQRVSEAMTGALPPLATELIAVGEESGRLDELCLRVAEAYDIEVRRTLRTIVGLIEPALILLFGLVVGFIALAMLQAIYGLNPAAL
jgi:general secretion pathway protein F